VSVVLLEQLDNLGHKGEEVTVAPGYARNYLVPERKAVYATEPNRKLHKVVLPDAEQQAVTLQREINMLQRRIAETRLRFVQATTDGTNLYGSVTSADITEALAGSALRKLDIKQRNVRAVGAAAGEKVLLKAVGEHTIEIEARKGLWSPLRVLIESS